MKSFIILYCRRLTSIALLAGNYEERNRYMNISVVSVVMWV